MISSILSFGVGAVAGFATACMWVERMVREKK